MATLITKFNGSTGNAPSSLTQGELAVNTADGRLFVGHSSGVVEVAPKVLPSVNTLTFNGTASQTTYSLVHKHFSSNTSTASLFAKFQDADGTQVGSITHNQYATTYATSSDYRLKEDLQAVPNATTRTLALNPVNFQWIGSTERTDGFLAHELAVQVPDAVVGEKDAVDSEGNPIYQGIDQAKIVPLLVKTIQELEARITALESA